MERIASRVFRQLGTSIFTVAVVVADVDNDGFTKRAGIYRRAVAGDVMFASSPTSTSSREPPTLVRSKPRLTVSVAPPSMFSPPEV